MSILLRAFCANSEGRGKGKNLLENPGIDPGTSHMLSERSTT